MERNTYISASELGDYTFCKRGWWLRQHGLLETTTAMTKGTQKHNALFSQLRSLLNLQTILMWGGIVLLVIILILLLTI